jgi:hypothetical protein
MWENKSNVSFTTPLNSLRMLARREVRCLCTAFKECQEAQPYVSLIWFTQERSHSMRVSPTSKKRGQWQTPIWLSLHSWSASINDYLRTLLIACQSPLEFSCLDLTNLKIQSLLCLFW